MNETGVTVLNEIILKNADILTMNDGPALRRGDLYLADGKIREIHFAEDGIPERRKSPEEMSSEQMCGIAEGGGPAVNGGISDGGGGSGGKAEAEEVPGSCKAPIVCDCTGCVVMPGLIDSHVHFDESYMGDFFLAAGVTSVRNMRGFEGHARWAKEIREGKRRGPYLYSSGPVYDGEDPTIPDNDNVILHTEADAEEAIRFVKANGFLWMKTYPMIEPELYKYLLRRCMEEGIPACGHMTKRMDHRYLADHGYVCCEHTSSLPADPETVRYLAERGMWLCPTHVVCETMPDYVWGDKKLEDLPHYEELPAFVRQTWEEQNEVIIRNYRELGIHPDFQTIIDRGLTFVRYAGAGHILAGTDCAYPGVIPGFALADELERLTDIYGLSNYEALCAATCGPARFIGIEKEKGRLLPGMDADLIVLEGNPLEEIGAVRRIRRVFQGTRTWDSEALRQLLAAVGEIKKEEVEFITGADGKPLG